MTMREPLLTPADRTEETGDAMPLVEIKSATSERKTAQPGPGARLFPRKVQGLQGDSPKKLQRAYRQLQLTIKELDKLPDNIKKNLTIPDEKTLNFAAIHWGLERAIIDEEFWRRIKGLSLFAVIFYGGQPLLRSLTGGIVSATVALKPDSLVTPSQGFGLGWEISEWPAVIFSCMFGTTSGLGYGTTEETTEEDLKTLQSEIDRWVEHIRKVELALQNPAPEAAAREEERIAPDHQTASTVPNQTEQQDLSRSVLLPRGLCR